MEFCNSFIRRVCRQCRKAERPSDRGEQCASDGSSRRQR